MAITHGAAAARSLSVFPCKRVQASACKTVPPRGLTCDARDATSVKSNCFLLLATQVMDSHGGKSNSTNKSRNQEDETHPLVLIITPTNLQGEPHAYSMISGTPQQPHLQEGTQGSPAPPNSVSSPSQGLPPDAFSREAGCGKEGPPQHRRFQDQGGHGEGKVQFCRSYVRLSPSQSLCPSLWHLLFNKGFFQCCGWGAWTSSLNVPLSRWGTAGGGRARSSAALCTPATGSGGRSRLRDRRGPLRPPAGRPCPHWNTLTPLGHQPLCPPAPGLR